MTIESSKNGAVTRSVAITT